MIRLHAHDDRGRSVRLVRFVPPPSGAGGEPLRAAARIARAVRGVIWSPPGRWLLLVGTLGLVMTWLTVRFGPQVIAYTLFSPVSTVVIVLGCLLAVACINWARERAEEIKRGAIRAGRCPACGYALEELLPEEDDCVICPECGAAWRAGDSRYTSDQPSVIVVTAEHGTTESAPEPDARRR